MEDRKQQKQIAVLCNHFLCLGILFGTVNYPHRMPVCQIHAAKENIMTLAGLYTNNSHSSTHVKCTLLSAVTAQKSNNAQRSHRNRKSTGTRPLEMLFSAALYDTWQRSDGTLLYTFTILTMDAHKSIFNWVSQYLTNAESDVIRDI